MVAVLQYPQIEVNNHGDRPRPCKDVTRYSIRLGMLAKAYIGGAEACIAGVYSWGDLVYHDHNQQHPLCSVGPVK